jgi:O-antigen/teichoic acid export membrane protein
MRLSPRTGAPSGQTSPVLHVTLSGVVLRGGQSLISLLNVELLAHALGPAGRGEYFLFVAAVAVLARVFDLGMSPTAVVFAGGYPGALRLLHRRFAGALLGLCVTALALGSLVLGVAGQGIADLPRERVWLALIVLPLAMYEQIWIHLMVGSRQVMTMNVLQLGAGTATLVCNVLLVTLMPGGVTAAVLIYCGVLLLKTPIMVALFQRGLGDPGHETVLPNVRETVSFSLRGYPNALAALLWSRLPAFVLDVLHGSGAVGVFSVAQQLQEQLMLPVQATQDAIYHNMSRLERPAATPAMNRYLRTALWAMLPLCLICGILAPWGVPFVFGSPFEASAPVFQILLVGQVGSIISALLSPYFFGQLRRPDLASSIAWLRVLLAVGLCLLLAPGLAEVGVAAGLAIAEGCTTLVVLALYLRMAATPMGQAVLPQWADFAYVLRRVSRA